jgi:hypothetical protein
MPMKIAAPYASAHLLGLGDSSSPGAPYPDQSYDNPFNVTLTANQILQTSQPVDRDADFVWRGVVLNGSTGLYEIQFDVNGWYKLSGSQILSTNMQSDPSQPFVIFPEQCIPAGGRIGMLITDLSGAPNTLQLVFRGVKRFTASAGQGS